MPFTPCIGTTRHYPTLMSQTGGCHTWYWLSVHRRIANHIATQLLQLDHEVLSVAWTMADTSTGRVVILSSRMSRWGAGASACLVVGHRPDVVTRLLPPQGPAHR